MPRTIKPRIVESTSVEKNLNTALSTYEHSLQQERLELNIRLDRLVFFMNSSQFNDVDPVHQHLYTQQMQLYVQLSQVLLMRLDQYQTDRRRAQFNADLQQ